MTGIDYFAWFVLIVLFVTVVAGWIVLAMLPGRIAKQRNHPQADAINVSGWCGAIAMGVFWPLALIWAFHKPAETGKSLASDNGEIEALKNRINELETELGTHKA